MMWREKKANISSFFKLKFQLAFQKDCNNMHFCTQCFRKFSAPSKYYVIQITTLLSSVYKFPPSLVYSFYVFLSAQLKTEHEITHEDFYKALVDNLKLYLQLTLNILTVYLKELTILHNKLLSCDNIGSYIIAYKMSNIFIFLFFSFLFFHLFLLVGG